MRDLRRMMFYKKLWILIAAVVCIAIAIFALKPLLASCVMSDIDNKNKLAAFMSDYFGLVLNAITLVVLFLAFFDQTKNNEINDINTRFYELLNIHRENTNEMELAGINGKKVFLALLEEFRSILDVVKNAIPPTSAISQKEIIGIAYTVFYYGVGAPSNQQLNEPLSDYDPALVKRIVTATSRWRSHTQAASVQGSGYTEADGHQIRLGHYYRNLFQLVDFIDGSANLTNAQKKNYLKTLRAQLTTHEQAMMYLNSLSSMGNPWWTKKFITKYRIVSNIPLGFFDPITEVDIIADFEHGYFEHQHRGA